MRPRLSIGIIRPRRHSRWCSSKAKSDIICPALTQDAESLLRTTNRFDKHDTAPCIKFTLIVVGILSPDPALHWVLDFAVSTVCYRRADQSHTGVWELDRSARPAVFWPHFCLAIAVPGDVPPE